MKSIWETQARPQFPKLRENIETDVLIVGGGLCGLLSAYEIMERTGRQVTLIEKGELCSGTTAKTTAKITAQHRLLYHKLFSHLGYDDAQQYADDQRAAILRFGEIIEKEQIACDFRYANAYVYAQNEKDFIALNHEAEAAQRLGFDTALVRDTELPFAVQGALCFTRQAQFHPLKFCYALSELLQKRGAAIYTNTPALQKDDFIASLRAGKITTDAAEIKANRILLCTRYPFLDKRSLFFTRLHQNRSYIVALKGAPRMRGMYLDAGKSGLSFRSLMQDGEEFLLVGGLSHKTGHKTKDAPLETLKLRAQRLFPGSEVVASWATQDVITHDGLPYIGRYEQISGELYFATGFNKWGMTGSMSAAMLLGGALAGHETPSLYASTRKNRLKYKRYLADLGDTVIRFSYYLAPHVKTSHSLEPEEGGVRCAGRRRVGAYRDEDGQLHLIQPVCTHLGCPLRWNREAKTWDCPCHGSRFDYDGRVLEHPAIDPLQRYELRSEAEKSGTLAKNH